MVLTLFWACNSNESNTPNSENSLVKEKKALLVNKVMQVHDEAMPWMEQIHALKKELNQKMDSVQSDSVQAELNKAVLELDSADEAMMAWMRQYREPADTVKFESAREYLLAQKSEIERVKTLMNQAIENAKSLVE
jgi:hypothetical protein